MDPRYGSGYVHGVTPHDHAYAPQPAHGYPVRVIPPGQALTAFAGGITNKFVMFVYTPLKHAHAVCECASLHILTLYHTVSSCVSALARTHPCPPMPRAPTQDVSGIHRRRDYE